MIEVIRRLSVVQRLERLIAAHFEKLEQLHQESKNSSLRFTQEIEALEPVLAELLASTTSQSNALVGTLDRLDEISKQQEELRQMLASILERLNHRPADLENEDR